MTGAESYRMQIKWSTKTTEWLKRASVYTGFHEILADIICRSVEPQQTVCDLGCGAGLIDFAMHGKVKQITCVDKSASIIHMLQKDICQKEIKNMNTICEDITTLYGKWDVVMAVFVGNVMHNLKKFLELCNDKLIIVTRGGCINNTLVGEKAREIHSLLPIYTQLYEEGVNFWVSDYYLEYGQPFTDQKEAYEYVELYHKNPYNMSIVDYLNRNLIQTNHENYPWYLPNKKHFAVIEIRKVENLHLL